MRALRYAALLALAVWGGGLVALGSIAAPATFDVTAARGVADHRVLAGAIFGEALSRFHRIAYLCAAILLLSLIARRILGPRPAHAGIRALLASLMLAATIYSGVVVSARVSELQQQIGASPSSLAADDPRRVEFNRLHATSGMLLLVPILGAMALMWFELRD
jgi:hypothetical protein